MRHFNWCGGSHKTNSVCFPCRYTTKGTMKCPKCGNDLIDTGDKWRFPPSHKKSEWRKLMHTIRNHNAYFKNLLKDITV